MKEHKLGIKVIAMVFALLLVSCLMPGKADAASSSEIKKQIDELEDQNADLKAQIKEIRSQYKANENEIQDMISRKDVIDQEISLLNSQVDNINAQISAYGQLIADKQEDLEDAQARLAELSEKNRDRIRTMEEEGSLSYWEVLFEANSFADLLDRMNMMQEIAASDQRRLDEMNAVATEIAETQKQLSEEMDALELVRQELDETEEELTKKREEADKILVELAAKGEEIQAMLDESEALQDELMEEIAGLKDDYKEAKHKEWLATSVPASAKPGGDTTPSNQAPSSSGWVRPVKSYRLTSPFGMRIHPITGKETMHQGVDMAAPQGTPIYAAKDGKVTRTAFQAGGAGYYVSISHGGGFSSVYMHMTHYIVSPGQYVKAGQVIGYVGSTGGSTGPHLHFGIAYNGTYVNPLKYVS